MKILGWILGVALVLGVGYWAMWLYTGDSPLSGVTAPNTTKNENRYHWGAVVRPFALDVAGQPTSWQRGIPEQLDLLKAMGGTVVRANIENNNGVMDMLVSEANQRGLDVLLILEVAGDNPVLNNDIQKDQLYALGKKLGQETASRFKGKVQYYQLANEVSGTAARRPEDKGDTLDNRYDLKYDKNRAERLAQYTKGLADGVKAGDKNAKRMLTGHWVLVDIIPYLQDQGVNFELVGWDWYSDMGSNPSQTKIDGQPDFDMPKFFTDLGKEFWLAEVNKEAGSFKNTGDKQADYLKEVATAAWADNDISGFVVHMLPDMAAELEEEVGQLGIVTVEEQSDGSWDFGNPKPAYHVLQDIFTANPERTATN